MRLFDSVEKVLVYQTTGEHVHWDDTKDVWWHEVITGMSETCPAVVMDAEDMLLFYTHQDQPANQRVWYIPAGAIWFTHVILSVMYFNISKVMFTGVRQMWAGLPAILILFTDRYYPEPPL